MSSRLPTIFFLPLPLLVDTADVLPLYFSKSEACSSSPCVGFQPDDIAVAARGRRFFRVSRPMFHRTNRPSSFACGVTAIVTALVNSSTANRFCVNSTANILPSTTPKNKPCRSSPESQSP